MGLLTRGFSALFALLLLAACAMPPLPGHNAASDDRTFESLDGLKITPLDVQPDEIAEILDIERWKFYVVLPEPDLKIAYKLELRQPGKAPVILAKDEATADTTDEEVLVALYSMDTSLSRDDEIKYYLKTANGKSHFIIPNPFKDFAVGQESRPATVQPDGSFLLTRFFVGFPKSGEEMIYSDENENKLVFTIERAD